MGSVPDDERYAVVVCPRCRHAKGIDRTHQTTTCPRCAARHDVAGLRTLFRTGDADRLRVAVGLVEAKVTGGDAGLLDAQAMQAEIEAQTSPAPLASAAGRDDEALVQLAASRAASVVAIPKKVARILETLDEARSDGFAVHLVEDAFEAASLPRERADREIRRALVAHELFEPRPGFLKVLR